MSAYVIGAAVTLAVYSLVTNIGEKIFSRSVTNFFEDAWQEAFDRVDRFIADATARKDQQDRIAFMYLKERMIQDYNEQRRITILHYQTEINSLDGLRDPYPGVPKSTKPPPF